MTAVVEISVFDVKPRPQGSKRHVGGGRMIEQSKHVKSYRAEIRREAAAAMMGQATPSGPVRIAVTFWFKRPASHYRGKSGVLRDDAPRTHAHGMQRGDLDKLLRAVLDALTGVAFHDDRQVVAIQALAIAGGRDATVVGVYEVDA